MLLSQETCEHAHIYKLNDFFFFQLTWLYKVKGKILYFLYSLMQVIHGSRYSFTKAFCIAFVMTFFSAFDVPVFWPILLCYWIVLFVLTMRRQIAHMIKYKYVPFNIGKQVSLNYFSLFLCISPLSLLEAPSVHSMDYNCIGISI